MPHPFPGMNPYLEHPGGWQGFHNTLAVHLQHDLANRVAPKYIVAIEQRTYTMEITGLELIGQPDVAVVKQEEARPLRRETATASATAVTVEVPLLDHLRESYLEVRDQVTGDLVTSIEILSPTNKLPGEGRQEYEKKRMHVLATLTNLVEIDLLRDGEPMPVYRASRMGDYRILVSRSRGRPRAEMFPFSVRDPIPIFIIPLRRGDPEPDVDLGRLIQDVYDRARYDLQIDYRKEPVPPLPEADRAWADELLRRAGVR